MEAGIVHDDGHSGLQGWQQVLLKLGIEHFGIGKALEPAGSHKAGIQQSGDDADTFFPAAGLGCRAALTFCAPAIGVDVIGVHACFIHPYALVFRDSFEFLQERCALGFVTFFVAIGVFFLVIPSFLSLRLMANRLTSSPHASAIC